MKIGFHVSIAGGIDNSINRARELGINTFQIFTRNPRMWKAREITVEEIDNFKKKRREYDMEPVFSHMPYLPNFATPREEVYEKSLKTLDKEIKNCNSLGIPFIVTHLGSHLGSGKKEGKRRIINAINNITNKFQETPEILLENSSGKTNEIGSNFQEIASIMDEVDNKTGLCLDTCHAFAEGYDIKSIKGLERMITSIEDIIGWKNLRLIHLNDSKGELGSKIDRHEHIGLGKIGEDSFTNILNSRLASKPIIMETPIDNIRDDKGNLRKVYELLDMS
jgi:deoxyribonuclease-4